MQVTVAYSSKKSSGSLYSHSYGYSDGTYQNTNALGSYTPTVFEVSDFANSTAKYTCTAKVIRSWSFSASSTLYTHVMLKSEGISTTQLVTNIWGSASATAGLSVYVLSSDGVVDRIVTMSGSYSSTYDSISFSDTIDGKPVFSPSDNGQTIALKFKFY